MPCVWQYCQTQGNADFLDDYSKLEKRVRAAVKAAIDKFDGHTYVRLFSRVSDADLARLGIDHDLLMIVRLMTSDAHLDAMQKMLPDSQYKALAGLAADYTPEEVWAEISQDMSAEPVDTGGAGTGKTVTALHRAAFLARRVSGELGAEEERRPVLLTTFTRNLAESLQTQFELLADSEDVRRQVKILNVDRLARQVVQQARGTAPDIPPDTTGLRKAAAERAGRSFAPTFLKQEWEQVILAQDLRGEQEYLTCSRAGQGTPLGKVHRRQVWQATQRVEAKLRDRGQSKLLELANEAHAAPA